MEIKTHLAKCMILKGNFEHSPSFVNTYKYVHHGARKKLAFDSKSERRGFFPFMSYEFSNLDTFFGRKKCIKSYVITS